MPLDRWMHNTWATYNLNNTKDGTTQNIGLNGTALKRGQPELEHPGRAEQHRQR